jgi:ferredoxin
MRRTQVYYFSGTGNTLAVARALADELHGEAIPMASLEGEETVVTDAQVVGIAFPAYYADAPCIVRRFVRKLKVSDEAYLFGVVTYGGAAVAALDRLDRILAARGRALDAGFGVHMPQNAFRKFWENRPLAYRRSRRRVESIATAVEARRPGMDYTNGLLQKAVRPMDEVFERSSIRFLEKASSTPSPSGLTIEDLIPQIDASYSATETCTGCGICATVCPVENIEMVDGRPSWRHRCENCLACFNWCPTDALRGSVAKNEYRYRHPEVTMEDMVRQREGAKGKE